MERIPGRTPREGRAAISRPRAASTGCALRGWLLQLPGHTGPLEGGRDLARRPRAPREGGLAARGGAHISVRRWRARLCRQLAEERESGPAPAPARADLARCDDPRTHLRDALVKGDACRD